MRNVNLGGIPDGRMRFFWVLSQKQKDILITLKIEGLHMLHVKEMQMQRHETWIEYWFDRNMIEEDSLRSLIHATLLNSFTRESLKKATGQ
jgi:hypothetical protein